MTKKLPPTGAFSLTSAGTPAWERKDCSVRAMVSALGLSYDAAHLLLEKAGRKNKKGCIAAVLSKALGGAEFIRYDIRCTYAQWLRAHLEGTHIVFVTGHFFAVVNGTQLDMGVSLYRPRKRMIGYWRVA